MWKVRFAHPEYGQVLATCSFDNTIQIYDKDGKLIFYILSFK